MPLTLGAPPVIYAAAPSAPTKPSPPQTDLESRVAARKRELIVEILEHKKSLRLGAPDACRRLTSRLEQLTMIVERGVTKGWANVADDTRQELDLWIAQ